jgi:hypothetical protein
MPFIAPIVGAVGAAIGAVGSFVGSLGIVGQALLGIGASVLSSVIQKETAGKPEKQPGGVQFERQYGGDVPRQVACGLVGIAGHDTYVNTFGPSNGILQQIYTLSDFPCHGLSRVAIDGKWVTLGPVGEDGMQKVTSGEYADLIRIQFVDGTQTAAVAGLVTAANPADRWTADHIGAGVAFVYVALAFTEPLTSFPDFFFEFYGARLYDWRKDSTVGGSGGHRWGNYATYEFTENPVVMEYNYRRGIAWNGDLFCGMGMPASDLPLAKWTDAANICDESTDYGTRYRCSIMLDCTAMHGENISSLQLSCGAKKVDAVDGSWPLVGHDQAVVATIADDDLIVGVRGRWTARRSMSDLVNSVAGNFPDPDQLWSMIGYETQTSPALVTLDRRNRDIAVDFPMVRSKDQAAQLAGIYLEENRYEATGEEVWRPRFQVLEPGDWIRRIGRTHGDRIYQITGLSLASHDADGPRNVSVTLQEVDGAIYDGITAPPIVVPMPPGAPVLLNEVQSFSLIAISLQGSNGRLLPGIRAAWATIDDVTITAVDIQYYPTAQPAAVITKTVPASQTVIILAEGLVSNTEYTVRTRLRTDPPRVIAWTAGETVMTDSITDEAEEFARWVAEEVARQSGAAFAAIDALREDFGQLIAEQDAQNWRDKEEWGFQLSASAERVTASYTEKITVVASDVAGIASQVVQLQAELDNLDAGVTFRSVAAVSLPAGALAAYEAAAEVSDGVYTARAAMMIAAYSNAGVTYSTFEAEADLFVLTRRVNDIRVSPFVSNASGIFIQGNLIVDGSITAPKLNVASIDAISGNFGEMWAGRIRPPSGKMDINLNSVYIDFWS